MNGNEQMNIAKVLNGKLQPGDLVVSTADDTDGYTQLETRLNDNLAEYHEQLLCFGKQELIEMAGAIAAKCDAHYYLTNHHQFEGSEIKYLLLFQNPLDVVADEWRARTEDLSDISFAINSVISRQDAIEGGYPLMSDIVVSENSELRRFMGVDLISFLADISQKVIVHYPNDWQTDKKALLRIADSPDMSDKRLAWHVSSYGTHLLKECDVFLMNTSDFNFWTEYRPNDPDMFGYFIEVIRRSGDSVIGNVFEVGNYAEHVQYVRETALPSNSVTLTYADGWGANAGKTITVTRNEYDNDRHYLMSESGDVTSVKYNPSESYREMSELLRQERAKRMALPIGSTHEHLHNLDIKLAEIRGIPESPQKAARAETGENKVTPVKPAKTQTFEELLKSAQAKADEINRQNALNAQNQPNKKNNIHMEAI